ncbi:MAG TPA: pirin-like C-terminal cupin domain-containing protein, partial [Aquihabitans sp.]|nr:pirin-like C-terminal cupin domain-containing protein [Aquihabitans sp.]
HHEDEAGRATVVTVYAGALGDAQALAPPPDSWAARPESDLAIWHIELAPGATWTLPAAVGPDTIRTLYAFAGDLRADAHPLGTDTGAVVRCDRVVTLTGGDEGAEVLLLQGRPIGEPVARYGPFVMTTEDEIRQAFADYQRTGFGGWPWADDAPDNGRERGRFARHADGRLEERDG